MNEELQLRCYGRQEALKSARSSNRECEARILIRNAARYFERQRNF